jgi:putative nucleotidyltransferase with HDIG domain
VGTYFHDIGKMIRPGYFIENQGSNFKTNPHDRLSPSLSALIVKAHIKEGIELARLYRLPEAVIRMIPEHHGTTLIKVFYDKASLLDPSVQESDFRYPGPKPRSKEGGLLMLADTLEASSRTLPEFSLARIQGLVQRAIRTKFLDGQLDECDMTLKDLHAIARSFIQTLASIYHGRIRYEPQYEPQEKQGTPPKKSYRVGAGKPRNVPRFAPQEVQGYDEAALKRLGL